MDNRFSLKKRKPKIKILCFLSFTYLLFLVTFFVFFSFDFGTAYDGIYSCKKNHCTITSFLQVSEVVELKTSQKLILNKQEQNLQIEKIYDPELVNNVAIQQVVFKVPKQEFYENQTVSFVIRKTKKNIWEILWESLKGGDVL